MARIIELVEEFEWVSPMMVQEKKMKGDIKIFVDLQKLSDACIHDPFTTPFTDEVLENVGGEEAYSFTNRFSRYNQIEIAPEEKSKTTFPKEWGLFQYIVMPFRLENSPTIFSRVVVATFKEFILKVLEVYIDDWIVFWLVKKHVSSLHLMFDTCRKYEISLNLKKFIFCVPYGTLLGQVVSKHGLMVDLAKIIVMINLEHLRNVKNLRDIGSY